MTMFNDDLQGLHSSSFMTHQMEWNVWQENSEATRMDQEGEKWKCETIAIRVPKLPAPFNCLVSLTRDTAMIHWIIDSKSNVSKILVDRVNRSAANERDESKSFWLNTDQEEIMTTFVREWNVGATIWSPRYWMPLIRLTGQHWMRSRPAYHVSLLEWGWPVNPGVPFGYFISAVIGEGLQASSKRERSPLTDDGGDDEDGKAQDLCLKTLISVVEDVFLLSSS
jgi:hypothetical protein